MENRSQLKEKPIDNTPVSETALSELKGRLTQIANIHPTAGNLATYAYGYDVDHYTGQSTMLGQRTSMNATVPAESFNNHQTKYYYDSNYQLTGADYPNVAPFNAEVDSWTYDAIGNRLTNTLNGNTANYTYFKNGSNPLNGQRLQSDSVNTYAYDNNGNTISRTGHTFTWDYEDRMTAISGGVTASYTYDYLGRRTSKTVGGLTTTYLYDGQNLIREVSTTTADYCFGRAIDEPLAVSRSGSVSYYNADGLGSMSGLNDTSGTVQNNYVLDAWGVFKSQNEAVPNPFTYTAREAGEAGLMFYRARYYNPGVGRFVSEDPIGWEEGPNFYRYVGNDPMLRTDPSGRRRIGVGAGRACVDKKCKKENVAPNYMSKSEDFDLWMPIPDPGMCEDSDALCGRTAVLKIPDHFKCTIKCDCDGKPTHIECVPEEIWIPTYNPEKYPPNQLPPGWPPCPLNKGPEAGGA